MKKIIWFALLVLLGAVIYPLIVKANVKHETPQIVSHVTVLPNEYIPMPAVKLSNEALIAQEFWDAPIMIEIARAESRFIASAKNSSSTASGLFQILQSTWNDAKCKGDVFNAMDNIACARIIFDQSGTVPWNESKGTWGKYL